jgi:hypothetical protein
MNSFKSMTSLSSIVISNEFMISFVGSVFATILVSFIVVPLVIIVYEWRKYYGLRWLIASEYMMIQAKCLRVIVKLSFGDNDEKILFDSCRNGEIKQLLKHIIYGLFNDHIFLMLQKASNEMILASIKETDTDAITEYLEVLNDCLNKLENMIRLLAAYPKFQDNFFESRSVLMGLIDFLSRIKSTKEEPKTSTIDFNLLVLETELSQMLIYFAKKIERLSKPYKKKVETNLQRSTINKQRCRYLWAVKQYYNKNGMGKCLWILIQDLSRNSIQHFKREKNAFLKKIRRLKSGRITRNE